MIGNLIQRLEGFQERRKTKQHTEKLMRSAEKLKEDNEGTVYEIADLSWIAVH